MKIMESEDARQKRLDQLQAFLSGKTWNCAICGKPFIPKGDPPANACESCVKSIKPSRLSFPASLEIKGKRIRGQFRPGGGNHGK